MATVKVMIMSESGNEMLDTFIVKTFMIRDEVALSNAIRDDISDEFDVEDEK